MKQKIFTLALFLFFGGYLHAQKVKNVNVSVFYNRLADEPLSKAFTTYSASIRSKYDDLETSNFTHSGLIDRYFKLRGFKNLPRGGHFHINVTAGRFRVLSSQTKKHESTTKDKEGNEKKVVQYTKEVVYSMPLKLIVEDKDGNILIENIQGNPSDGIKYSHKPANT